jgi:hypothetical protein
MKTGLLVIAICLLGCQRSESTLVEPQGLFQTWTLTGSPQLPPNALIVEFRRDRQLLYGADKQKAWCCSPATFEATPSQIEFFFDANPDPACHLLDCGLSPLAVGPSWRIDQLTHSELVLTAGNRTLTFRPY